jgi:hypothetical protein
MNRSIFAIATSAAIVASADAAIVAFTSYGDWAGASANAELALFASTFTPAMHTENFNGGPTTSAPSLTGGSSWNAWTATATSGVQTNGNALLTSSAGNALMLSFPNAGGEPKLLAVGGNFNLYNANGQKMDGRIWVRLANGSSIVRNFTANDNFVGFWSDDLAAPITSMRIQATGSGSSAFTVGVDNLYLATVPAPGAVALLGAAALVGWNRRRA